ncbi:unnamed protein product [Leptidea sinapis]|uniref:Uncharacterized protein n=1 Tax=Leptidea sinapis TaxID=189913 RepID=A0A5E4PYH9_9NEOP|nr:unnamed protein product [Leptidea sinapis]
MYHCVNLKKSYTCFNLFDSFHIYNVMYKRYQGLRTIRHSNGWFS